MNNKKYYWLCSYPLEERSIVLPGNWGRIISEYTTQNNILIYCREKVFEDIRIKSYPHLPSRMKSIFLCEDLNLLGDFQIQTNRTFDLKYQVELLDDKPIFETDWTFVNFPQGVFKLSEFENMAKKYWEAKNIISKEILTESRIKIIKRLN